MQSSRCRVPTLGSESHSCGVLVQIAGVIIALGEHSKSLKPVTIVVSTRSRSSSHVDHCTVAKERTGRAERIRLRIDALDFARVDINMTDPDGFARDFERVLLRLVDRQNVGVADNSQLHGGNACGALLLKCARSGPRWPSVRSKRYV